MRETVERPTPAEHIPYYEKYISLVREGEDVLKLLEERYGVAP